MYAENLKAIRKELKLSVEKMSEMIGIPASTLWGYEGKKRTPSIDLPIQLYRVFNINANWFLLGEGDMFNSPNYEDVKDDILEEVNRVLEKYGVKKK